MANIRENKKNGKVISFRFTVCLERDVRGKQIRKYTTWTAPADLMPAKARKAAERAADAWEEEVKAEYQVQRGQVVQRDASSVPLVVVFQKALRGFEGRWAQLDFCVVFHPDLQPTPHRVGLGPSVVDADVFLDGFLQLFLDLCLRLAEDVFDDGLASLWIVADSVSSLPASVLSLADVPFPVRSSFRHKISPFRQRTIP